MRRWGMVAVLFGLGLLTATFAAKRGSAHVTDGTLTASVGPGFSISLTENGSSVTSLAPGTYTIDVSDLATVHDFHLSGPGVDQATTIPGTGSAVWTVTLSAGSYHYQCDAHPTILHGDFTVGQSATTTTTPTTTAPTTTSAPPPTSTTTPTTTATPPTTTTPPATTPPAPPGTTTTSTETTVTATPTSTKLAARVSRVTASRTRIAVSIVVTRSAHVTVELLTRRAVRVARLSTTVVHAARITLRPSHRLAPGRYLLRIRLAAGGRTAVTTRVVRVS